MKNFKHTKTDHGMVVAYHTQLLLFVFNQNNYEF